MKNTLPFSASLKLPQIIALYIGAVLGSGILIIPGVAAEIAGPASLISWGIMSILVFPMALTIGLLSAKYPSTGGVSYFVTRAFSPILGSLTGWLFLMSIIVGVPVLALTGAGYLCSALGLNDSYRLFIACLIIIVGLLTNYFGMNITGNIQIAVVVTTLIVLTITIISGATKVESSNFRSLSSSNWTDVGYTTTILFWCFVGWEAVAHLSEEFKNPRKEAIRGTIIAAIIINAVYFMSAFVVVGTHSYGAGISEASLLHVITKSFGIYGALIAGFVALFICIAPAIAYIGAVSRLAYSLSVNGYAPKQLSRLSKKYNTPLGGLVFLAFCFSVLLAVFGSRIITMSDLLQIPNASLIIVYIAACIAGVKLLKNNRFGLTISCVSLVLSLIVLLFIKWSILYPLGITVLWLIYSFITKKVKVKRQV